MKRILPYLTIFTVLAMAAGCGKSTDVSEVGQRPQRLVQSQGVHTENPFVGDWGPVKRYVANDWIARFAPDGRMSVEGPGMVARGYYTVEDEAAQVTYTARDGDALTGATLSRGTYRLSANRQEITFQTGIPDDPPVHLRRIK